MLDGETITIGRRNKNVWTKEKTSKKEISDKPNEEDYGS